MERRQALDQMAAQRRAYFGPAGEARRKSVADDDAGAVLDDLERCAEHRVIGAKIQRSRRQRIGPPQG
jgi:hypothetical protein